MSATKVAPAPRRPEPDQINPVAGCTVVIEDHGQDFLEFDIQQGVIVATRPFQGFAWNGRTIMNATLAPGDYIGFENQVLKCKTWLNYPIVEVRALNVAAQSEQRSPYAPIDKDRDERHSRPVTPASSLPEDAGRDACATASAKTSAYEQRIPRLATTQRQCLCCGKPFASQGPHNRLCSTCRAKSVGPYDL